MDLLPKKYTKVNFNMSSEQSLIYVSIKNIILNELLEEFEGMTLFKLIGYLQRVSCGYLNNVINDVEINFIDYGRAKKLYETIQENTDKKIIVFYKYNSDVKLIKRYVKNFYLVNGYVNTDNKNKIINAFKKNKNKILLLNIASGSFGLNLQFANCIIYYSNTFDYAKRIQSEDRIYRIGQEQQTYIIDLVCNNNIDNKIMQNLSGKGYVANDLREKIKKAQQDKEYAKELRKEIENEW